jgi:hypothetical protein
VLVLGGRAGDRFAAGCPMVVFPTGAAAWTHRDRRPVCRRASASLVARAAFLRGPARFRGPRGLPVHEHLGDFVPVRPVPAGLEVVAEADVEAVWAWHGPFDMACPTQRRRDGRLFLGIAGMRKGGSAAGVPPAADRVPGCTLYFSAPLSGATGRARTAGRPQSTSGFSVRRRSPPSADTRAKVAPQSVPSRKRAGSCAAVETVNAWNGG